MDTKDRTIMLDHRSHLHGAIATQVSLYHRIDVADEVIDVLLSTSVAGLMAAVEAAQFSCITLVEDGVVFSVAATDPIAARIDELQSKYDDGPSLTAARQLHNAVIDDYGTETRWQLFTEDVIGQTPVRSTISFPLFRESTSMGALNIHSDRPHAFDDDAVARGSVFATQVASAFNAETNVERFRTALASRDVIGQAKGVLMQQYRLDADGAFEMLRRLSQELNTKLVDLAQQVVDTQFAQTMTDDRHLRSIHREEP